MSEGAAMNWEKAPAIAVRFIAGLGTTFARVTCPADHTELHLPLNPPPRPVAVCPVCTRLYRLVVTVEVAGPPTESKAADDAPAGALERESDG